MPPTRSQVKSWQPWSYRDAGDVIDKMAGRLDGEMTKILRGIDSMDAGGQWVGRGQTAAFNRANTEQGFANKVAYGFERLADAARTTAGALESSAGRLLALATAAESDGFTVTDNWKVMLAPTVLSTEEMTAKQVALSQWQTQIAAAVGDLDEADQLGVQAARESISGLPAAAGTDIPGPLPHPPADPGAGPYDSQPWYAILDDKLFKEFARTFVGVADRLGMTNAARHLKHYLDNTGADLTVNPDNIMRDVPKVQATSNMLLDQEVRKAVANAAATGSYGQPVEFKSDWRGTSVTKEDSQDWFYAMGSMEQSVTGQVTVHKPTPGGQPTVTVDYKTHVYDRYNWDGGKSVTIAGITITDAKMGALHTAGIAKEYDISGSGSLQHYEGVVADNKPLEGLPHAPETRDGTRTDPGRDSRDGAP